jgi:MFS family permease
MRIAYLEPFERAWERMKLDLFRPFDLHKWFVVGFNAFLAGLAESRNGSAGWKGREDMTFREFLDLPHRGWEWLTSHPGWFIAIGALAVVVIAIGIVLLWLSSRGKFMFLDNVVHNRAEIAKPWREFQKEGDSLFLWRLVFGCIAVAIFVAFSVFFFVGARQLYDVGFGRRVPILFLVGLGLTFFFLLIIIGYISLFLNDFVVPIMRKERLSTVAGWRRFLPLLGHHPFQFILYGLLIFVLYVLFVILVIFAGLVTCCIGWLVLVIPYIGTVATLPVWYTFRAFSLEFLAQFGPEYALFPAPPTQPEGPPA